MSCREILSMLSAYIDGEVREADADMIREHLAQCASCAREFSLLQRTAGVLASVPEVEPPAYLLEEIEAATVKRPGFRKRLRAALEPLMRAPAYARWAAVTAAAGVLIAVFVFQPGMERHPLFGLHPPSSETIATQPGAPEDSGARVGATQPAPETGGVTVVERPVRTPRLYREARPARELAGVATSAADRLVDETMALAEADEDAGTLALGTETVPATEVASEPPPETPASVDVASALRGLESAGEKAETEKTSPALGRLEQEGDALAELRAQIAARNKQKRHEVRLEPVEGRKYSVALASIRF